MAGWEHSRFWVLLLPEGAALKSRKSVKTGCRQSVWEGRRGNSWRKADEKEQRQQLLNSLHAAGSLRCGREQQGPRTQAYPWGSSALTCAQPVHFPSSSWAPGDTFTCANLSAGRGLVRGSVLSWDGSQSLWNVTGPKLGPSGDSGSTQSPSPPHGAATSDRDSGIFLGDSRFR